MLEPLELPPAAELLELGLDPLVELDGEEEDCANATPANAEVAIAKVRSLFMMHLVRSLLPNYGNPRSELPAVWPALYPITKSTSRTPGTNVAKIRQFPRFSENLARAKSAVFSA